MNHTPTPWTNNGDCLTAADGERYLLYFPIDNHARMAQSTDPESAAFGKALLQEDEANAAFITRACNAHEALVAALETAEGFRYSSPDTWYPAVQAALKLARGE